MEKLVLMRHGMFGSDDSDDGTSQTQVEEASRQLIPHLEGYKLGIFSSPSPRAYETAVCLRRVLQHHCSGDIDPEIRENGYLENGSGLFWIRIIPWAEEHQEAAIVAVTHQNCIPELLLTLHHYYPQHACIPDFLKKLAELPEGTQRFEYAQALVYDVKRQEITILPAP